jgi:hypothetical protein
MKKGVKRLPAIISILAVIILLPEAGPASDTTEDISMSGLLVNWVKMLGGLPWQRRAAREVMEGLPDPEIQVPVPDSQTIYGWVADLCADDHREMGTPEGRRSEDYIADRFREFGLEQVTKEPLDITLWRARKWKLTVHDQGREIEIPSFYMSKTAFTGPEGITAPMVYVDKGFVSRNFTRSKVEGKIVVADVPFAVFPLGAMLDLLGGGYCLYDPDNTIKWNTRLTMIFARVNMVGGTAEGMTTSMDVFWKAHKLGAAGVVFILSNMPSNSNSHSGPDDDFIKPLPGLWVGKFDGHELRPLAQKGASAALVLQGDTEPAVAHNVWGVLPGRSDSIIMINSHHDTPFKGATEDGTGVGMVLAQAWAWSQVPEQKRDKTLVFVTTTGHFYNTKGSYTFARNHEHDLMKRVDVLLCLEHLAAKQVREQGREFAFTGRPATAFLFTSPNKHVIAGVMKTLEDHPLQRTVAIPSNLLTQWPPTEVTGFLKVREVNVVSWITCPYYLLSAEDTLDKIEVEALGPNAEAVTGLVAAYMRMESSRFIP